MPSHGCIGSPCWICHPQQIGHPIYVPVYVPVYVPWPQPIFAPPPQPFPQPHIVWCGGPGGTIGSGTSGFSSATPP